MGYLNNSSITVDAILTNKGRDLLSRGQNEFNITQFALADDEVDYNLWNPAHPLGSDYYGIIIDNMPLVEALPDETQMMKYKLITLAKDTTRIPIINISNSAIVLQAGGDVATVKPNTSNFDGGNKTLGYTAILSDNTVADLRVSAGAALTAAGASPSVPRFIGDTESAQSVAVSGFSFDIEAKTQVVSDKEATITIIGNETGGRVTATITVKKLNSYTA
jgi:hypothetical protein